MPDLTVVDAPEHERYEARIDGELVGFLTYTPAGRRIVLNHTEVFEGHEGEGIGGTLVRAVLDGLREEDEPREVVPVCPFAAQWLLRHRDYAPLVTPALRPQFE